jgi:hypothetical protein
LAHLAAKAVIAALAVLCTSTSALSADAPNFEPSIAGLDLGSLPSVLGHRTDALGRATENYYPQVAYDRQVAGVAVLDCKVSAKGELDACAVVAEWPLHCYFGAAAKRLAERRAISASPEVMSEHPSGNDVVRQKVLFNLFRLRSDARC